MQFFENFTSCICANLDYLKNALKLDLTRFPANLDGVNSHNWAILYKSLFAQHECARILWFSLYALQDEADSFMVSTRRFIEGLINIGSSVKAITSFLHTPNTDLTLVKQASQQIVRFNRHNNSPQQSNNDINVVSFVDNTTESMVLRLQADTLSTMTRDDQRLLEQGLLQGAKDYAPDVTLVTGSDPCSLKLFALLKQACHKLIYVATGHEEGFWGEDYDSFNQRTQPTAPITSARFELGGLYTVPLTGQEVLELFDKVVTYSPELADKWREHLSYPIECLGYLARPTWAPDLSQDAKFVSITSNAPEHGFAVFLKVALMFQERNSEVKFLINTENYVPLQALGEQYHFVDGSPLKHSLHKLTNLKFVTHHANLDRLYDQSLVMLLPELNEHFLAEPLVNALVNGVPVVTTSNGENLPLAQGITYIPTPQRTQADMFCLPSDEKAEPFVQAIEKWLESDHIANRRLAMQSYALESAQQAWRQALLPYGGVLGAF